MEKNLFDKNVIISNPSDWETSPMKEVDRLLRCPICFEFFQTPMILPCSHSFCSLCIRRYLQHKNSCPICSKPAIAGNLLNNVLVGQLCAHFTKHRRDLLNITLARHMEEKSRVGDKLPSPAQRSSKGGAGSFVPPPPLNFLLDEDNAEEEIEKSEEKKTEELEHGCKMEKEEEEAVLPPHSPSLFESPVCRGEAKRGLRFGDLHPEKEYFRKPEYDTECASSGDVKCDALGSDAHSLQKQSPAITPGNHGDSAECPVCGIQLLTKHVNNHLDICLRYSSSREETAAVRSPRLLPRLPKLCYNLMKNNDLKRKLKEYHLPTAGSRQTLVSRLKEFTLQYNAQCDSPDPKSMRDIATEVEMLEKARLTPQKKSAISLKLNRSSTEEEIEKQRTRYAATAHRNGFDSLISGIRKRLLPSNMSNEEDDTGVKRGKYVSENKDKEMKQNKKKKRRYRENCDSDDDPDFDPSKVSKQTA